MQETWARRDLQENREQEVLNMSSCVHVNKLTSSSPFFFFFFFFLANSLFMASSSSVYWPKEFWCPFSCMPSCVSLHVWIAFSSCTLSVSLLFCLVRLLRWTASLSSLTSFPSASCHLFLFCQTPWERHALPMKGSNNLIERLTTETKSKSMMKPFRLTCFSCPYVIPVSSLYPPCVAKCIFKLRHYSLEVEKRGHRKEGIQMQMCVCMQKERLGFMMM